MYKYKVGYLRKSIIYFGDAERSSW